MKIVSDDYAQLFVLLTEAVESFIQEVKKHNGSDMATEEWSIHDVLCHITFYHKYYADNYEALAKGTTPTVHKSRGGSIRNQKGVESLRPTPQKDLIASLYQSQERLYKSIVIKKVPKMNYTDRRTYETNDFLEMITRHIQTHTTQVRTAKKFL